MTSRFAAFTVVWALAFVAMSPSDSYAEKAGGGGTCKSESGSCCLCLSADNICQKVENTPGFYAETCSPGVCSDFCLLG